MLSKLSIIVIIISIISLNKLYSYSIYDCINKSTVCEKYYTNENAGDILQIAVPLGAIAYSAAIKDTTGITQFLYGYTATFAVTQVLKYSTQKTRPNGSIRSFPSGHTSSAFAGASFLQIRYGWKFGVPAYALATYVGMSRVEAQKHFFSDVVVGAGIAIASSYIFTSPYLQEKNIMVIPTVSKNEAKISLVFSLK